MDLEVLKVILQAGATVGIIGGSIWAVIQIRQVHRAAHVANFTKLVELQLQQRRLRVEHPELAGVYRHDVEGFADDREVREYFLNLMQLSVFEIAWFSHRYGQLSEDYFRSWETRMMAIMEERSFQAAMKRPSMKIMHDGFQRYVMELMARSRAGGEAVKRS